MKVLAIDPGFGRCGVAVLEKTRSGDILLYSSCIETTGADEFADRLNTIISEVHRLCEEFSPQSFALEKLYFSKNQKTAMHVAEVRGALIQAASEQGIPYSEYGPGQIKQATTGSGSADKQQVARMVRALLKIDKAIRHDDEYDAIAVGITHLAHARIAQLHESR